MVRFVDLKTGNTFDGSYPYIFWMDGEQSINLIYSKSICFISREELINVSMEDNNVFSLIDPSKLINSKLENIYGFEYHDINSLKTNKLTSIGVSHHNYFVHMIYVISSASQAGEYISNLKIGDETYKVGGDFYGEEESLYINLSNNGIEIPEAIQKALYDVNIHEERRDNIVLNRKWKELLSNYWDVVANKGSYKSLFNSLKWFEYGDNISLKSFWKNAKNDRFFAEDIRQTVENKYLDELNGFIKTTYIAIYYALEQITIRDGRVILDEEKNPKLEYTISKWSNEDLALKLCMLGNFYKTYFMPIHLDLIHSTIEDVVYSNTFKVRQGSTADRIDYVYNVEDIKCNIKDGDIFRLGKVSCQVYPSTLFKASQNEEKKIIVGVQKSSNESLNNESVAISDFFSQYYNEIGCVVDFDIHLPISSDDRIKKEILVFKTYWNSEPIYKTVTDYKILGSNIQFSLLCPIEGEYEVRLQFDSVGGKIFTKRVKFNVIDTEHSAISVYRIYNKQIPLEEDLLKPSQLNEYNFSRYDMDIQNDNGLQYIPAIIEDPTKNPNIKGVRLNHLLVLEGKIELELLKNKYFVFPVKNEQYTVCISKKFGYRYINDPDMVGVYNELKSQNLIYRDDYIFVQEFHKLVPLDQERNGRMEELEYYKVTDNDALCIIPDISYGKCIEEYDWEFVNASRPMDEPIKLKGIKEPFIASKMKTFLPAGYYNVIFRYRLTNENKINTIELNSAFRKV